MAKYIILKSYDDYNARRYSAPWVAVMTDRGEYDFSSDVGMYTGNVRKGDAGDLVVFDPVVDQVYGYGQKDYRNLKASDKGFVRYDGTKFVKCDRLGRDITE